MKKLPLIVTVLIFTVSSGFSGRNPEKPEKYDYVIKNGRIVDGMGNAWFRADIGIYGDKIVKIGFIPKEMGISLIDATGKYVVPGFIDIHSHAERGVLEDRTVHNMIKQGCTTIVGGNCGGSPLNLKEFFEEFESRGAAVNVGVLVGHNTVRRKVMGNEGREPTREELNVMKKIVEEANIPVQMSHQKAAGADMWGQTKQSLKMMENARERGIDVTTDLHPYPATFTTCTILFPAWALEGDRAAIRKRLDDPATRKRVIDGIVYNIIHDRGGNDIRNITIAVYEKDRSLEGRNLKEILEAEGRNTTMQDAAALLIEIYESGGASCVYHCLSMEDIVRILQHPLAMYGSDAGNAVMGRGKVHPRHYGHFPRILALHVRDRGDLRLEEAVRKMTSFPASRSGIEDRGILSEGKCADIVILDLNTIQDKATFDDPHHYPEGIEVVIVNGQIVVDHNELTGKHPGRIIYGPGRQ